VARVKGHADVARLLEEHTAHRRSLEEMRRRQELFNRSPAKSAAGQQEADDPPCSSDNSSPRDDAEIDEDRSNLFNMMSSTSKDHDPIEISFQYIQRCITNRQLGSGAFGDVFLAEDRHLPKKFVVKKIKLAQSDQETIDEIQKSFQRELSVRFYIECGMTLDQTTMITPNIDDNADSSSNTYPSCIILPDAQAISSSQYHCFVRLQFKCQR
jgi:hypothetical protein